MPSENKMTLDSSFKIQGNKRGITESGIFLWSLYFLKAASTLACVASGQWYCEEGKGNAANIRMTRNAISPRKLSRMVVEIVLTLK